MRIRKLVLIVSVGAVAAALVQPVVAREPERLPGTVKGRLARKIPRVNVVRMPLMRVLAHYAKLSGVGIEPDWTGLEITGITKETPVTIKVKDLPFEKVLDLTLDTISRKGRPLTWYVSGGKVQVTSQRRAILSRRYRIGPSALAGTRRRVRVARGRSVREFNFSAIALKDVLEFLRELSGQNFHVNWRSMETVGITRDTPVTLKARGISVAKALDLALDGVNGSRDRFSSVYWIVEDGIVKVATGEVFNRTTKVRVLDVADLLMVVPNFKAPRINRLESSNNGNNSGSRGLFDDDDDDDDGRNDDDDDGESTRERRERIKQDLMDTIKMSIGDDMWAPIGKGSIRYLRNRLIISQTALGFKLLEDALSRR